MHASQKRMSMSKRGSVTGASSGGLKRKAKYKRLGSIMGTPTYMSPEIQSRQYDSGVDIWACGVLLYSLLCGQPPFFSQDPDEMQRLTATAQIDFHTNPLWTYISRPAKALIKMMLTRNPSARPGAAELLTHPWFAEQLPTGWERQAAAQKKLTEKAKLARLSPQLFDELALEKAERALRVQLISGRRVLAHQASFQAVQDQRADAATAAFKAAAAGAAPAPGVRKGGAVNALAAGQHPMAGQPGFTSGLRRETKLGAGAIGVGGGAGRLSSIGAGGGGAGGRLSSAPPAQEKSAIVLAAEERRQSRMIAKGQIPAAAPAKPGHTKKQASLGDHLSFAATSSPVVSGGKKAGIKKAKSVRSLKKAAGVKKAGSVKSGGGWVRAHVERDQDDEASGFRERASTFDDFDEVDEDDDDFDELDDEDEEAGGEEEEEEEEGEEEEDPYGDDVAEADLSFSDELWKKGGSKHAFNKRVVVVQRATLRWYDSAAAAERHAEDMDQVNSGLAASADLSIASSCLGEIPLLDITKVVSGNRALGVAQSSDWGDFVQASAPNVLLVQTKGRTYIFSHASSRGANAWAAKMARVLAALRSGCAPSDALTRALGHALAPCQPVHWPHPAGGCHGLGAGGDVDSEDAAYQLQTGWAAAGDLASASVSGPNAYGVRKAGLLLRKAGGIYKTWQQRWTMLSAGVLYYR
jgi:hypothetical protein